MAREHRHVWGSFRPLGLRASGGLGALVTRAGCVALLASLASCGAEGDNDDENDDAITNASLELKGESGAASRVAPDVLVRRGQTRELEAGRYGDVRLLRSREHAATRLVLLGGNYFFRTLELGTGTRFECATPCNVDVLGRVRGADRVYVGPKEYSCVYAADISLTSEIQQRFGARPAIRFGDAGDINALITVEAGTIAFGNDCKVRGNETAAHVFWGNGGEWTIDLTPFPLDDGNPCTRDSCDESAGEALHGALPDGASCDDGNACTLGDTCTAGSCQRTPVTCEGPDPDECHFIARCNPATGACELPPVPDGSACNDLDACTTGDTCQSGVCTGGGPTSCAASAPDSCHLGWSGTCNPQSGCVYALALGAACGPNDLAGQTCASVTNGEKPYGVLACTPECQLDASLCGVEPPRQLLRCGGNEGPMLLNFTIDTYGRAVNSAFGSPPSRQLSKAEVDELTAAAAALEVSTAGYDVYRGPTQHLMSYNASLVTFGPSQTQTFVATLVDGRDASARVVSRMKDPAAEVALKYSCASFVF